MRKEIHPDYHEITITCACGESFKSGSTKKGDGYRLEVCSSCHPFYTGKQKRAEVGGRIDRFNKRIKSK